MLIAGDPALLLSGVRIHIFRLHQRRVSGDTNVTRMKDLSVLWECSLFDADVFFLLLLIINIFYFHL